MKFKNIIFDCDSTLVKIEGLDEIARRKGKLAEVETITRRGMNGEIPYEVSFRRRWLEIIKPEREDLLWLGDCYIRNLVADAASVISELRSRGHRVFILSHVPEISVKILADHLAIAEDDIFAIPVEFGRDRLMSVPRKFLQEIGNFKNEMIKNLSRRGKTILIGDGITDYEAGKFADLFIGFGGVVFRPTLKKLCPFYVEEPRLQPILDIVL